MSKYLILGSNSFAGSSFVNYCVNQKNDVVGINRSKESSNIFLPILSNNNNDSWFDPRIDHSLSSTYGSQVFVIIPPDDAATFWINQSIIPAAEVTNPNDIALLNISVIGSYTLEDHYFTSIPISVGYHDNARIWSDAPNDSYKSLFL